MTDEHTPPPANDSDGAGSSGPSPATPAVGDASAARSSPRRSSGFEPQVLDKTVIALPLQGTGPGESGREVDARGPPHRPMGGGSAVAGPQSNHRREPAVHRRSARGG